MELEMNLEQVDPCCLMRARLYKVLFLSILLAFLSLLVPPQVYRSSPPFLPLPCPTKIGVVAVVSSTNLFESLASTHPPQH
jgi:hypothetical protein